MTREIATCTGRQTGFRKSQRGQPTTLAVGLAHGPDLDRASILGRRHEFWRAAFRAQSIEGAGAARAPGPGGRRR
jgi:hypothetical protein